MRRQTGTTALAVAMACSLMAGCSSGSGEVIAAATKMAKKESKEEAKDETKDETKGISARAENTGPEEGNKKKYVIGLAMNTQTNPFFVDIKGGVQEAAGKHGIKLYIIDVQGDPTIQMKDMKNLIIEKPDATIVDTYDSDAIASPIEARNDAGIPISIVDREANDDKVVSHISYDAIKLGRMAGQYLVGTLGGKGKIVGIQGIMGTNVTQNRSQGFNEVMKDDPDMEIVIYQAANFDRAKDVGVMGNILQANPEADRLYTTNGEMLLGVLEAMEVAGRTDGIVKIGCDAIDDTLDAMKVGKVGATIVESPFFLRKATLNTAYNYLEGKQIEPYVVLDDQLII